ncbi:MAG TPA: tetratricopeptide repeat protein [Terriglobia bacterium]|nr:tetratricopeptide repeat protein [Terriglobia bacterium]
MLGISEMDHAERARQNAVCGFRRCRARFLNTGLMVGFLLSTGLAAKPQSGTIFGTVKTEDGAAIAHAKVIARSSIGRVVASAVTDDQGRFHLPSVQPGAYEVDVEFPGKLKTNTGKITVKKGGRAELNFVGRTASGGAAGNTDGLGPVSFYNNSDFKQGGLKDPSGGGGYSNGASAQAVKILNQYVSSEETSVAESGIEGNERSGGPAGSDEEALERAGRMMLAKKNYTQSVKVFEKATDLYPRSESLRMGLGLSLYGAGKYPESAGALREAARLAPDDSAPIVMLAETLQFVQDPAAERLLEQFSKRHPENARGHYAYGLALWRDFRVQRIAEKLTGAQSEFETAVAQDPNDADAHLQLGMIYDEQNAAGRAVGEYLGAIRVNPRLASAHYHLAHDYERLGEKDKAVAEFDKCEKLGGHISP